MEIRNLQGSVAVVTGASSGIGEASARALAAEGVHVVLAARSADRLDALARQIGELALPIPTDVGDAEQVQALFDRVKERFGGLDLLLNNAGVGYFSPFESSDPEEWRKTIDANLYGVLRCTHAAIPLLHGRDGAMISTVASVGGRYGRAGWSVYNATKFAVVGFHDALRKELGEEGIRISLIEPGAVYTNWGFNVADEKMRARREKVDALHADDIANALVYAFAQPGRVNPQEILVMPTRQISP